MQYSTWAENKITWVRTKVLSKVVILPVKNTSTSSQVGAESNGGQI